MSEPTPEAVEELARAVHVLMFPKHADCDPTTPRLDEARLYLRAVLAAGYVKRDEMLAEVEKAITDAAPPRNAELDPRTGQEDPTMAAYVEGFHDAHSAVVDLRRPKSDGPTLDELQGILGNDWTGGLNSVDAIREQRS